MIKLVGLICLMASISALASWFSKNKGKAVLEWYGWHIESSVSFLVLCLLITIILLIAFYKLLSSIVNIPIKIRRNINLSNKKKGLTALEKGLIAVANGDKNISREYSITASKILKASPSTLLLELQSSALNNNQNKTHDVLNRMLSFSDTELLGIRGMISFYKKEKNLELSKKMINKAIKFYPNNKWLLTEVLDYSISNNNWLYADHNAPKIFKKSMNNDRIKGIIKLQVANSYYLNKNYKDAIIFAQNSVKLLKYFPPAISVLFDIHLKLKKHRGLKKILREAWREFPHPIIIKKAIELLEDTNKLKQIKMIQDITKSNPDNIETHIALARSKLNGNIWGEAKYHLFKAIEKNPSIRVYKLMALLEKNKKESSFWLNKAEKGEPDPTWVCKLCNYTQDEWIVSCIKCNSFDSLEWKYDVIKKNLILNRPNLLEAIH